MTKAELLEENENLKKQNGELLYLLEFGKLKCELRGGQMIWERDSMSWLLQNRIQQALEITHKIMMNNADNRMIANDEEKEYFDWLDSELLKQEELLKGVNYEQKNDI